MKTHTNKLFFFFLPVFKTKFSSARVVASLFPPPRSTEYNTRYVKAASRRNSSDRRRRVRAVYYRNILSFAATSLLVHVTCISQLRVRGGYVAAGAASPFVI